MKKILVPCDFSKPAIEAFKFAVSIAQQSHGEVHVLYVIDITFLKGNPTISNTYAFNLNFLKEIEKESEEKFAAMRRKYGPERMKITFKHSINSLISEIESYGTNHGIDLIVMGTHGLGEESFGSNTKKTVRNSAVPVIAVHTAHSRSIQEIVVPIWPDQKLNQFIEEVNKLQAFFQARLHLVKVNTPLLFKTDEESAQELKNFAGNFRNASIDIRSDYTIEAGILHFAKEIKADMVALGTHGRKGMIHLFTGSVAEDVVRDTTIPVWTYRLD